MKQFRSASQATVGLVERDDEAEDRVAMDEVDLHRKHAVSRFQAPHPEAVAFAEPGGQRAKEVGAARLRTECHPLAPLPSAQLEVNEAIDGIRVLASVTNRELLTAGPLEASPLPPQSSEIRV